MPRPTFLPHTADRARLPVALLSGCLCCNLAGDMEDAVMRLFSRRETGALPQFRRLIIEPSGLSDPAPIAQAILRNPVMARGLRLVSIVTTVDAPFGIQHLEQHPETRKQVALADQVVITKTDVAPAEPLRAIVAALNPTASVREAPFGQIDAAHLFPADFFDPEAPATRRSVLFADADLETPSETAADPSHLTRYASATLTAEHPLEWRAFEAWLRRIRLTHAESLLRVKGILNIHNTPGPIVIHGIHHVLNAPVQLDSWPSPDHRSRLVLIADPATIVAARESWTAALPALLAG